MKIIALAADDGGCGFYRIREPARVAKDLGVDITVTNTLEVIADQDPSTGMTIVKEIKTDADLIIMQRPMDNAFTSVARQARRQGIATIVEIDDDFETVHTQNIAHVGITGTESHGARWVREACREADHVIVSTPALEKYAPHKRVSILRNCMPKSVFDLTPSYERAKPDRLQIGWTGTVQTHPTDLQTTRGRVAELVTENDLGIHVVGDGEKVLANLGLPRTTPFHATGWVDMDTYWNEIGNMDLGIVPLEISPFNQAKSALKGLEMAALGVPFVASDTREYARTSIYGVGKIAKSPGDWKKHLQRWIDRPQEALKTAKQYREIVYNEMVYENRAQDWISTWEKAVAYRKSQS